MNLYFLLTLRWWNQQGLWWRHDDASMLLHPNWHTGSIFIKRNISSKCDKGKIGECTVSLLNKEKENSFSACVFLITPHYHKFKRRKSHIKINRANNWIPHSCFPLVKKRLFGWCECFLFLRCSHCVNLKHAKVLGNVFTNEIIIGNKLMVWITLCFMERSPFTHVLCLKLASRITEKKLIRVQLKGKEKEK